MHFNQFFSAKANFKVCIEVQKIRLPLFSISIPTIKSTITLNDYGDFNPCTYIHTGTYMPLLCFVYQYYKLDEE